MKSDNELKRDIENELRWEPSISNCHIGVHVSNGVVTLSGHVPRLAEKMVAEKAVKRLYAVKGVANELAVRLPEGSRRTDDDVAAACENAIENYFCIPKEKVTVSVLDGWVTLKGEVDWRSQKEDAAAAVHKLMGVRGVNNEITIKQHFAPEDMNRRIFEAFHQCADIDASRIQVEATDGTITLAGNVSSWKEKDEAQRVAYSVAGVSAVDNRISVDCSTSSSSQ